MPEVYPDIFHTFYIIDMSLNSPIEGLSIIDDFITEEEEIELINLIDLCEWSGNGIP